MKKVVIRLAQTFIVSLFLMSGLFLPHVSAGPNDLIQVGPSDLRGQAPTSGFVDKNGNPISQADYEKMRKQESENVIQRNPVASAVVGVVVVAGVVFIILRKKSKNKT